MRVFKPGVHLYLLRKRVVFLLAGILVSLTLAHSLLFECPRTPRPVYETLSMVNAEPLMPDDTIPPELRPAPPVEEEKKEEKKGREVVTYTIQKGDTPADIAKRYGIKMTTLQAANPDLSVRRLKLGAQLNIPPSDGIMVKVGRGENLWALCRRFKASLEDTLTFNGVADVKSVRPGDNLFLPGGVVPPPTATPKPVERAPIYAKAKLNSREVSSTPISQAGKESSLLSFLIPVKGRLSSLFGWRANPMGPNPRNSGQFHAGLDLAAPRGQTVCASETGQVVSACYDTGGLGLAVVISHKQGFSTVYGHNSKLLVRAGDFVTKGTPISLVGSTGRSTGCHLHFEVRKNGSALNPLNYLR